MPERRILIIDDEPDLTELLAYRLKRQGYSVTTAHDAKHGQAAVEEGFVGVVLLDLKLPDADGLDLVEPLTALAPTNRIIIMTAHGTIDAAVEATRKGAYDFVAKTGNLVESITVAVKNAFRDREMSTRVTDLEEQVTQRYQFGNIVARSPRMLKLFEMLSHVIDSRVTMLIQGESGTGKELVARAIHYEGPRKRGPFVAVNCAGIPDTLLESELFGHERGAFTGAIATKKGRFELAEGGTIFLDEIGEMPPQLQAKILRVIQERTVERLGSTQTRPVDVRIISATHRNLQRMVEDGAFREDLFYRLSVFPVQLPPLRDRQGDVALLARHFLTEACREENKAPKVLSSAALHVLERYPFPGNVRELQNVISRAVLVSEAREVSVADLPPTIGDMVRQLPTVGPPVLAEFHTGELSDTLHLLFPELNQLPTVRSMETALIRCAMALAGNKATTAAKALGLSRATLYRRLETLDLVDRGTPGSGAS